MSRAVNPRPPTPRAKAQTRPDRPSATPAGAPAAPPDLAQLAKGRLLVVGDIILDRYVWADVSRISPEAPTPVALESGVTDAGGGAFNVARNALAAGARVHLIGVIGKDEAGEKITELMKELGLGTDGLLVDPSRPTTTKTRIISGGHQLLRIDREAPRDLDPGLEAKLIAHVRRLIPGVDAVILSDYRKGVVTAAVAKGVAEAARQANLMVIADPKRLDTAFYAGVDYMTPNLKEATEAAGAPLRTSEEIEAAGRRMIKAYRGRGIIITRGHEGLSVIPKVGAATHIPAQAREVFDVTGAGDTFIAHFALALAAGFGLEDAARIGNAAAGVAVSKPGAVTVSPAELAAAFGNLSGSAAESLSKTRTVDDLRLTLNRLRGEGRKVVLAVGDFARLDALLSRQLIELRRNGDVLVVAVVPDRRAAGGKTPGGGAKTGGTLGERAAILSNFPAVDYVAFDPKAEVAGLVEQFRPAHWSVLWTRGA